MEWWKPERTRSAEARRIDRELAELCDASQALVAYALEKLTPDIGLADWERGALMAANQAFNTLRSGWGLVSAGFPVQALALARLAHEYLLLTRVCREHPDRVAEIFDRAVSAGKIGQILFSEEPELGGVFQTMRSSLNQFAHQSAVGLGLSVLPDADGEFALTLGPFLDRTVLREAGYELVACSTLVIAELVRWLGARDSEWMLDAGHFALKANRWLSTCVPHRLAMLPTALSHPHRSV